MNKIRMILSALAISIFSSTTTAATIDGTVAFEGGITAANGTSVLDATVFNFINPVTVTAAGGDLRGLDFGGSVTYNTLDLNNLPILPLWTATVATGSTPPTILYEFDLDRVIYDGVINNKVRIIDGIGTMRIPGFADDTKFTWTLSTQLPAAGFGQVFSFSAAQAVVPIPAAVWLFGSGLIGLVGVARRKNS